MSAAYLAKKAWQIMFAPKSDTRTPDAALIYGGWPTDPALLDQLATRMTAVAYRGAQHKKIPADTAKALKPMAEHLIKKAGVFVPMPKGAAADIATHFSYDDGKWTTAATKLLQMIFKQLPKDIGVNNMGIEMPVWALSKKPIRLIQDVSAFLAEDGGPATGVMQPWQDSVHFRLSDMKGVEIEHLPHRQAFPPSWDEMMPPDLMAEVFRGSPLEDLLSVWVPITIPDQASRTHTHGMGPTGQGKTTFNEAKILAELGHKGMVLIDTKGGMAKRLISQSGKAEHILEVRFHDEEQRPLFNLAQPPIGAKKSQVAKLIGAALKGLGIKMTDLQEGDFERITEIVQSIPAATLDTFIRVLADEDFAARHVRHCSDDIQEWFGTQYNSHTVTESRKAIQRRLEKIRGCEELDGLFNGDRNTLDMQALLDAKKLVIFSISKKHFREYTQIISRACIGAINAAMWRRDLPVNGPDWVLYFDELRDIIGSYDDSMIEELADQGREYHVCLHFTHQRLEQMSKDVASAILNNASTTFYANIKPTDAGQLAERMGCKKSDMLNIHNDEYLYFCLAIKGYAHAARCRIRWDHIKGRRALSASAMEAHTRSHKDYWASVNGQPKPRIGKETRPLLTVVSSEPGVLEAVAPLPWEEDDEE